ncbi:MAG: DUF4062 domain-containing protein [Rhodomicrobium sp.]
MAGGVIDVFLSSTALDLAGYRKAIHDRLVRTKLFRCTWQEDFGAQNVGALDFCRRKVREADMVVGLIGLRRGWEPDGDAEKRSITEMEHDWARDAGRPHYIWVMPDDFPLPGNLHESDGLRARQMAFRRRVMGGGGEHIVSQKGFGSPDLLASEIVEHLMIQVVTTDLLKLIQPEADGRAAPARDDRAPAVAAAIKRFANNRDADLLGFANGLNTKLTRDKLEAKAGRPAIKRADDNAGTPFSAYDDCAKRDPANVETPGRHVWPGDPRAARKTRIPLESLWELSASFIQLSRTEQGRGNLVKAETWAKKGALLAQTIGWPEGESRAREALRSIKLLRELAPTEA